MPSSVLRGGCWIRYQNDFEFEDLTSLYHLSFICLVENKEQLRELNNVYRIGPTPLYVSDVMGLDPGRTSDRGKVRRSVFSRSDVGDGQKGKFSLPFSAALKYCFLLVTC